MDPSVIVESGGLLAFAAAVYHAVVRLSSSVERIAESLAKIDARTAACPKLAAETAERRDVDGR